MPNKKENTVEECPVCKSKRIISARHDCDWGGGNSLGAVNPKEHYNEYDLDENEDVENFGDIDIRVCLECDFTWQRYTDPVKILRKYLEVQKKSPPKRGHVFTPLRVLQTSTLMMILKTQLEKLLETIATCHSELGLRSN